MHGKDWSSAVAGLSLLMPPRLRATASGGSRKPWQTAPRHARRRAHPLLGLNTLTTYLPELADGS
eukprot:scaffold7710_cov277-Pinguiococcus_pyrenoidosus.AAC.3